MIASLSVHLPVYDILGELADRIRLQEEEARKAVTFEPAEVDFEVPGSAEPQRRKKKAARQREKAKRERLAKAAEAQARAQAQQQQKTPPPELTSPQAVQQHSTNPDLEPDNPQFIAEEN
ncbi:MAG: hypothetical protein HKN10_00910, partial [Myxococcales bacterium]|nr:hypothetical protein [Myxococcales bacterium]